jgi:hypothetical protein
LSEGQSRNKDVLPIVSRLFGVYQPITGWKGNLAKKRVALEQEENIKSIIESMINDISIREILGQGDLRTLRPDTELVVRPPEWMDTEVVKYLREHAGARTNTVAGENDGTVDSTNATHQAASKTTTDIEFEGKVRRYFEREKISEVAKARQKVATNPVVTTADRSEESNKGTVERTNETIESRQDIEKTSISKLVTELECAIRKLNPEDSFNASVTAGVLGWLKETSPDLLYNLCFQNKTNWEIQTNFVDPIADFDSEIHMPILSPIGMVHLFCINPDESAGSDDDFLESLKEESKKNIRFAICDNGDEELAIYLDEATADVGYEKNVTHAKDVAALRLGKKIRRSMKKVDVKVQHIDTQMCWQIYLDEPGHRLGIPGLERMDVPEGIQTTINWFPFKEYENAVQEKIKQSGKVRRLTSAELREEESYILYRYILQYLMGAETSRKKHVSDEIFRSLFDIENIFYYIAPDWWLPRIHGEQHTAQLDEAGNGEVSAKQWLVQLDGDNRRNALLNSPWVKVVIPIREGREESALKWLQLAHVEGNDGLDAVYQTGDSEAQDEPITLGRTLDLLAQEILQQRITDSLLDDPQEAADTDNKNGCFSEAPIME